MFVETSYFIYYQKVNFWEAWQSLGRNYVARDLDTQQKSWEGCEHFPLVVLLMYNFVHICSLGTIQYMLL